MKNNAQSNNAALVTPRVPQLAKGASKTKLQKKKPSISPTEVMRETFTQKRTERLTPPSKKGQSKRPLGSMNPGVYAEIDYANSLCLYRQILEPWAYSGARLPAPLGLPTATSNETFVFTMIPCVGPSGANTSFAAVFVPSLVGSVYNCPTGSSLDAPAVAWTSSNAPSYSSISTLMERYRVVGMGVEIEEFNVGNLSGGRITLGLMPLRNVITTAGQSTGSITVAMDNSENSVMFNDVALLDAVQAVWFPTGTSGAYSTPSTLYPVGLQLRIPSNAGYLLQEELAIVVEGIGLPTTQSISVRVHLHLEFIPIQTSSADIFDTALALGSEAGMAQAAMSFQLNGMSELRSMVTTSPHERTSGKGASGFDRQGFWSDAWATIKNIGSKASKIAGTIAPLFPGQWGQILSRGSKVGSALFDSAEFRLHLLACATGRPQLSPVSVYVLTNKRLDRDDQTRLLLELLKPFELFPAPIQERTVFRQPMSECKVCEIFPDGSYGPPVVQMVPQGPPVPSYSQPDDDVVSTSSFVSVLSKQKRM